MARYSSDWKSKRAIVLERDEGRCKKCNSASGLQIHHIIPKDAGGTDEIENLLALCETCHYEWEFLAQRTPLSFSEWLETPPLLYLLAIFHNKKFWAQDISAQEAKEQIIALSKQIYLRNLAETHMAKKEKEAYQRRLGSRKGC